MKRIRPRLSSKRALIAATTAGVAAIGLYVYASVGAWNDISQRTEVYKNQSTALTETFFATGDVSSADRRASVKKMVERGAISCEPGGMSAWQSSFSKELQDRQSQCDQAVKARDALASKAAAVKQYYETIDTITAIVRTLSVPEKSVSPSSYQSQLDRVQSVKSDLDQVDATGDASVSMKKAALTSVGKIESAWNGIIKANKKEDRGAFEKAMKNLTVAYASLGDISKTAKAAYVLVTDELATIE